MSVEEFSDALILYGQENEMQDVYFYVYEKTGAIYFRQETKLELYKEVEKSFLQQLIARFKYLGEMDVGEKRKAQLGAITYRTSQGTQRLRVSTVGDYQGNESLVMRFLHTFEKQTHSYFFEEDPQILSTCLDKKRGLFLFSGPTGAGKTTLMYQLAKAAKGQVIAIEDPVEIEEPTFLQLQTNEKIDQTYEQLIKLSLRHRPDVLIVGEIRDEATAKAAIRAALTGHCVYATVHAKGVDETRHRLLDLVGSESELQNCLLGVVYQELHYDANGVLRALLGYRFFDENAVEVSWEKRYSQLKREGRVL